MSNEINFSYEIQIGDTRFNIQETATDHLDFFKKVSFFTSLPTEGPNGEKDLKLVARKTNKGYYYSVVCESAKKEFKLGVSQQEPGTLFPKGWEDLYAGDGMQPQVNSTPVNNVTPQVQNPVVHQAPNNSGPAPVVQNPVVTQTPAVTPTPTVQTPIVTPVVNSPPTPQVQNPVVQTPTAVPTPTTAPTPQAPVAQTPQNNAAINSVLSKYGINK